MANTGAIYIAECLDRASPVFVYPRVNVIAFVSAYFDSTDCELTTMRSEYLSWDRFEGLRQREE